MSDFKLTHKKASKLSEYVALRITKSGFFYFIEH